MITVSAMKVAIRISHNYLDEEIEGLMEAAKLDMRRVGIDTDNADDDLTDMLMKLYVKWMMDYDGKGPQYEGQYKSLRDALSLSSDYMEATT